MEYVDTQCTFAQLGISDELCQTVQRLGYAYPMPIQQAVIPFLLQQKQDLIALAQTGTGKTAAYALPMLQRIQPHQQLPQALILCPTRELCMQITHDMKDFAASMHAIRITAVYGGASVVDQKKALKAGTHIIVATPGRLIDMVNRGYADICGIRTLILDEADEMLNMGFREDMDNIIDLISKAEQHHDKRRTLLFSATMSRELENVARSYLTNPKEIVVGSRNEGAENVNHIYYLIHAKDKYLALKRIVDYYPRIYAIIFCRTKNETQQVADCLIRDGYNAEALHGDLAQQQRDITMQKFRTHVTQLLVATDVAARGLDVDDLTHVIHYALPNDAETYTHRSGRTGRAGKKGTSIAIIHNREVKRIADFEKQIGKTIRHQQLPTAKDICTKQLFKVIDEIENADIDENDIAPFMQHLQVRFGYLDKETIIKKVITREFGKFLTYYAQAPDIENVTAPKSHPNGKEKDRKDEDNPHLGRKHKHEKGYKAVQVNLGKHEGFYPGVVMQLINRHIPGRQTVGHIELYEHKAVIEVPARDAQKVAKALNGKWYKDKEIKAKTDN